MANAQSLVSDSRRMLDKLHLGVANGLGLSHWRRTKSMRLCFGGPLVGEGAPMGGTSGQIPAGGGTSCFLPRVGASMVRGRGSAPGRSLRW